MAVAGAAATAGPAERTLASRLPGFPWDRLAPAAATAAAHPDGIADLSIGTPVDPVPAVIQDALAAAANSPGYPLTRGTGELRAAAAGWLARRHQVSVSPDDVLPVIGTKELIAWLPTLLGCGPSDAVSFPALAYPTYDIGARLAGARAVATDEPDHLAALTRWRRARPPGLAQLAVEPDRPGTAAGADARPRRLGQGDRGGAGLRRVLPRPRLRRDAGLGAASRCLRVVARRAAGRLLAVQAVQPGRLPGRLRGGRRSAWSPRCSRYASMPG